MINLTSDELVEKLKKDKIISLGSSESNVNANNNDRKLEAEHAFGWYETMVNDLFI